jgi:serine/threonine-protein kinase
LRQVGKYQLVSKLATGGMAEVFLAKVAGPMGFEKTLVLKRILPHLAEDSQFVRMFFTEARVAAQLNHPHIVQTFDFGQAEGTYYLAMEHIDGPDLRTLSARATQAGEQLPPAFCAKLISAACEGLAFAHDFVDPSTGWHLEIIHRDISPDNLLLSRQGTLKIVDFGIAKATNQNHKTQAGLIKGKIAYMPPEQLQGQPLDRRADVYALGVVLYELLTGKYPFEASTDVSMMQAILFEPLIPVASRRPDLPEALFHILERALAKVREQRYPDCVTFQSDLERFILSTGQPMGARELAQWVERLCPRSTGLVKLPAASGEADAIALEPTTISRQGLPAVGAPPAALIALAGSEAEPAQLERTLFQTALPEKTVDSQWEEVVPRARRSYTGLGVALGSLALLAAGGGVLLFRGDTAPATAQPQPVVPPPQPMPPPPPPPQPVAEVAERPPEPRPEQPVETQEPTAVQPARRKVAQKARLEFRIRPHAIVFLDGKALGQTPFPAIQASIGTHTVRLINRDLDRDITRTIEVKAGQPNIFKYDFLSK